MAAQVRRLWMVAAVLSLWSQSAGVAAWRLEVITTPRAVERTIGTTATVACDARNMDPGTQYLAWIFLDADSVRDQPVSTRTAVRETYRERFSVTLVSTGVRRFRYSLSIRALTPEDDGTYICQVVDTFTRTVVQSATVSVSVLYFPDPPSCAPSGGFSVMANSLVKLSCSSASGNPTVDVRVSRQVAGVDVLPVVPLSATVGARTPNWTYHENDDMIVRTLTVDIHPGYTGGSFRCGISAPNPRVDPRSSGCVIGPIRVVPVPRTSTVSVSVEPRALSVTAGRPARFTCRVAVSPRAARARVQTTWSTFPAIEPERLVGRDANFGQTVWIRPAEVDDDGLVVTCRAVIRGVTREGSARLRVVPATLPPFTLPVRTTTAAPVTAVRTTRSLIGLVTGRNHATKSMVSDSIASTITATSNRSRLNTVPSAVTSGGKGLPTIPTALRRPWYAKPTGIALIIMTALFVSAVVLGIVYVRRFPRFPRLSRRVSQKRRSLRYQNVWGKASRQPPAGRREPSRRQRVTVSSTHIYHEAGVRPEKSRVDSTVEGLSGQPLVVYAETVVNSLYEADEDRSRTMPCLKSGASGKGSKPKYGNVISAGFNDSSKHVTLPNNFMIYSDFNLENANPYESLIGT